MPHATTSIPCLQCPLLLFCSFLRVGREAILEMTIWPVLIRVMADDCLHACGTPVLQGDRWGQGRDLVGLWMDRGHEA